MAERIHTSSNAPEQALTPELRALTGALVRDFRNSFKYSQGDPDLQLLLMTLLRDHYRGMEYGGREATTAALVLVGGFVSRFALPPWHKPMHGVHEEFQKAFKAFGRCLTDDDYMPTRSAYEDGRLVEYQFPVSRTERLGVLVEMMALAEEVYLGAEGVYAGVGRPRRESTHDPYESYLRAYVLAGKESHSDAYNTMFGQARSLLAANYYQFDLARHRAVWEHCHPGESYIPEEFRGMLQAARTVTYED